MYKKSVFAQNKISEIKNYVMFHNVQILTYKMIYHIKGPLFYSQSKIIHKKKINSKEFNVYEECFWRISKKILKLNADLSHTVAQSMSENCQ